MKKIIIVFSFFCTFTTAYTQIALAKLKFEDAETAYNNGEYTKSISRLDEAEKLFGKINPPILHLRILTQYKIYQKTGDLEIAFEAKKNTTRFLQDYADVEGLEDKYKDVYRIGENLADIPLTKESLKVLLEKKTEAYEQGKKKYIEIIEKNIEAIGGRSKLSSIKTIEVECSNFRFTKDEKKIQIMYRIKDKEKIYFEQEVGKAFTTYISTPGSLKWSTGPNKYLRIPTPNPTQDDIDIWNDKLTIFPELIPLNEKDSVFYNEEIMDGKKVFVLQKKTDKVLEKTIYDATTYLILSSNIKKTLPDKSIEEVVTEIQNYVTIENIKLTYILRQKIRNLSAKGELKNELVRLFTNTSIKLNPNFKDKDLE